MESLSATTTPSRTEEVVRHTTLARLRDALRSFGSAHEFLTPHLCGCGNPGCAQDSLETMSLLAMLRAVATEWVGDPDPQKEPLLHTRLGAFARAFGLLECPCADPQCPTAAAWRMDTRAFLRVIADMWHGRAGNRVTVGATSTEGWSDHVSLVVTDIADRYARNLGALTTFALRLDPADAHAFRPVLEAVEEQERSAWLTEARAMAAEAIATWLPAPGSIPEVERVMEGALSLAYHAGWTTWEAALLERAAADACSAVLTLGIVHISVSQKLFAPFTSVLPLADLDAAVAALLQAEERIAVAA
jgi:hypothetical protein